MGWVSVVGSGVSWVAGEIAEACGADKGEKQAIKGTINVAIGIGGALVDPVGGGILLVKGVAQMANTEVSGPVDVAAQTTSLLVGDRAIEAASASAENLLNIVM